MSEIFEAYDSDPVLLMLDNTAYCLAHLLKTVRENIDKPDNEFVLAVKTHITLRSGGHLKEVGDHEQARELANGLRTVRSYASTDPDMLKRYWVKVAAHYKQKHVEGCVLDEYLDLHYARYGKKADA